MNQDLFLNVLLWVRQRSDRHFDAGWDPHGVVFTIRARQGRYMGERSISAKQIELSQFDIVGRETMRLNLARELREMADKIEEGRDLMIHTYFHSQPWGSPEMGGVATDAIFMGASTVIHVGIANNAMLMERIRQDMGGQISISDVKMSVDGNEQRKPAGDQPGND